jgi:hypothetical protein
MYVADQIEMWNVSDGPGTIDGWGLYSAPASGPGEIAVVDAVVGGFSAQATIYIVNLGPGSPDGTVSGTVFDDVDGNGQRDNGDDGLPEWVVYVDSNGDNELDGGELSAISGEDGMYTISGLPIPGTQPIKVVPQESWLRTTGDLSPALDEENTEATGQDIGVQQQFLDVDVDSDNNNDTEPPDRSALEDAIESTVDGAKQVTVLSGDLDEDSVADTEDLDGIAGAAFAPVVVSLSEGIDSADLLSATLTFAYDATAFRLWMPGKDAPAARDLGTDLIADGASIDTDDLGLEPGGSVTLFLEALQPNEIPSVLTVNAAISLIDALNWLLTDQVRVQPDAGSHIDPTLATDTTYKNATGLIVNPAVVALRPTFANSTEQTAWQTTWKARFAITKLQADLVSGDLAAENQDSRIYWDLAPESKGQVEFVDRVGRDCTLYGTGQGKVTLVAYRKPADQAFDSNRDRAMDSVEFVVLPIKVVPYRAQILSSTANQANPNFNTTGLTAANVLEDINGANRFLRQLGILLVPDTTAPSDGAAATATSGIYTATTSHPIYNVERFLLNEKNIDRTRGMDKLLQMNSKANVLQIVYIKEFRADTRLGEAVSFPGAALEPGRIKPFRQVKFRHDNASLSRLRTTSFNGAGINGGSGSSNWGVMLAAQVRQQSDDGKLSYNYSDRRLVLAHEVGHFLGLIHRSTTAQESDLGEVREPFDRNNVMHPGIEVGVVRQIATSQPANPHAYYGIDFDLAQAYVVHQLASDKDGN